MIQKIENIRLGESEKKERNKWMEVKSKKTTLLSMTDWTQLPDIKNLSNSDEFKKWRKNLRVINLEQEFTNPEQALEFLYEYEKRIPSADFVEIEESGVDRDHNNQMEEIVNDLTTLREYIFESTSKLQQQIDKLHDLIEDAASGDDEIEYIEMEKAWDIAQDILVQEKDRALSVAGVMDYPIVKERIDQATDYLVDDYADLDDYILLKNDTNMSDNEYVEQVLADSKQYFKNLYSIEEDYLQRASSMYNMSINEINTMLEKHGYRYRCKP